MTAAPGAAAVASVTFALDGRPVCARQGTTLLQACRDEGVPLPTLCHLEGLPDVGACRLCLVEVEGSPRLAAACVTPVQEGIAVHTATPRLQRYRRMLVELLLAERNHPCAACVASGRCELQRLATALGVDHVRFPFQYPPCALDASHPRFVHDPSRCVLCTRCVRACAEVEGAHTWDVAGRGAGSRVVTDLADPWGASSSCTGCGKCVAVCPTGALFEKEPSAGGARDPAVLARLMAMREGSR